MENRLRYWRKRRGLSGAEVARRIGMSQPNYYRLESGQQQLTVELMRKLASAFNVSPIDLLPIAIAAGIDDELERAPITANDATNAALAARGLASFIVKTSRVNRAGVLAGATVLADCSPDAVKAVKTGDLIVVKVAGDNLVLRLFVAPALAVTNWDGSNTVIDLDDPDLSATIEGVVAR